MLRKILLAYLMKGEINLFDIDKNLLKTKANENGFNHANFEKVYRLIDILSFLNTNPFFSNALVLKGGTAINLTVFKLPRLSVDIDLDYNRQCSRKEMLHTRKEIQKQITQYLISHGYTLNQRKSRQTFSLDSWIFSYQNIAGNLDNIKIEINYSLRIHILPIKRTPISIDFMGLRPAISTLSVEELFGSKIKALLERCAPRDLYDINNLIGSKAFSEMDKSMLRKCFLFYRTVGSSEAFQGSFQLDSIEALTYSKIRQSLIPVLPKGEIIDLDKMKSAASDFLNVFLQFDEKEKAYLREFNKGLFRPDLLFDDSEIAKNLQGHPMALWKMSHQK